MFTTVLTVVTILASFVGILAPPKPIEVKVDKRVCLAPCTVELAVHVTPHHDNRWLAVVYGDAGGVVGTYEQSLNFGIQADTTYYFNLERLPVGQYLAEAAVLRQDNKGKRIAHSDRTRWEVKNGEGQYDSISLSFRRVAR